MDASPSSHRDARRPCALACVPCAMLPRRDAASVYRMTDACTHVHPYCLLQVRRRVASSSAALVAACLPVTASTKTPVRCSRPTAALRAITINIGKMRALSMPSKMDGAQDTR